MLPACLPRGPKGPAAGTDPGAKHHGRVELAAVQLQPNFTESMTSSWQGTL